MVPKEPMGKRRAARVNGGPLSEEARVDEALSRADELLVTSLKDEDRRRKRRRILVASLGLLSLAAIGGLALLSVTGWGLSGAGANRNTNSDSVAQEKGDATADQGRAAELSAEGWKLWQGQDLDAAVKKFEQAVQLDPKNSAAWNGLGWARFNGGDYQPASVAFNKVIELEPNHPAALNGLGQIALTERRYPDAEKFLLKAAPEAPAAWWGLAKLYLLTAEFDKSAKWAEKISASGEADEGIEQILKAAREKKLPDDLRRQIEPPAKPSNAGDVKRAWKLMNQGRSTEAKSLFAAIVAKSPNDADALNGLGWCLLNMGDAKEAKPVFEKALAADPDASGAMNGLARALDTQDDTDGAIKVWEKMTEKVPGPHAGTFGLVDAYLQKKEFKKAVPLLEQLCKAYPNDEQLKKKLQRARAGPSK